MPVVFYFFWADDDKMRCTVACSISNIQAFGKASGTMLLKNVINEFHYHFGGGEVSVYFSPGRVNLIGEHTDYNGGVVFPCALNLGTYLAIRKIDRKMIKMISANQPLTAEIHPDQYTRTHKNKWIAYPLGVLKQFFKKGVDLNHGIEMYFTGNLPIGAGLSSSAAIEVVTAYALNEILETGFDRIDLVKLSQKAEKESVGVNCGIMDQFASCMGKKGHAIFLDCNTLHHEFVPVALKDIKIVISNTNSPHKLDSVKYNERVSECRAAVDAIRRKKSIRFLGELSPEEFELYKGTIADKTIRRRASHVVSEIRRTVDAVKALKSGDIFQFGQLMNASHISLRNDYEVTGRALDVMVEEALNVKGVIGSRMTGGGFGGSTVSLVKEKVVDTFMESVGIQFTSRTGFTPDFYVAEIGNGATRIF